MKKSLLFIVVLLMSLAISMFSSTILYMIIPDGLFAEPTFNLILYIYTFGLTILIMSIICKYQGWITINFAPKIGRLDLSLILLSLFIIQALSIVLEPLLVYIPEFGIEKMYEMMQGGMWAIVSSVIAAPILEEFLFRGILQQNLVRFTNPIAGVLIASIIFGAIHIIPQQVIFVTLVGIVIGAIYYLTRSLATAIIIHMLNNGIAYTSFLFLGKDKSFREILNLSDNTYWTVYTLAAIFLLVVAYLGIRRIRKERYIIAKQPK